MVNKVTRLVCMVVAVLTFASCAAEKTAPSAEKQLPDLHIQPEVYQLGDIKEGENAVATFLIRNNAQEMVNLVDIQAACGCTAAAPESYMIMPGGFTVLKVSVDTTAKANNIKKTVHIRDSLGHTAEAALEFNVVENPHAMPKNSVKGIFDGKCASCHYTPLLGKRRAEDIFSLGCAMCHGKNAEGAYAANLRGFTSLASLKQLISKGIGKPQMPGFSKQFGGPLTDEQIHELAKWLMSLPAESE